MIFEKARLRNFRNFSEVDVQFSPRVNVFLGQNGQGKTNLLEALHLLTQGESFRYADNETLIQQSSHEAFIGANIRQNDLHFQLKMSLLKSKKTLFLNDKRVSSPEVRKIFASVVFSPESLAAIKEGADQRRLLVDNLLVTFDKKNVDLISDYRKALKTRNKILKNHLQGLQSRENTLLLLESLNPSFLRLARDLSFSRISALKGLEKEFNIAMQYISLNSDVDISVEYVISDENVLNFTAQDLENLMRKRQSELVEAELANGISLVGPHKHDIKFLYGQNDSRFYCSQGQQRAIILSFKMAQIVYHRKAHGIYPVLMLDDVLSELDKTKRDALINFLHEVNTQIFVTTTDFNLPDSFHLDKIAVLNIHEGKLCQKT